MAAQLWERLARRPARHRRADRARRLRAAARVAARARPPPRPQVPAARAAAPRDRRGAARRAVPALPAREARAGLPASSPGPPERPNCSVPRRRRIGGGLMSRSELHRRLRRPRAQPQGRHGRAAARRAGGHHRAVGLGQVVAGVRHDLRRGPAPLRRVAERLRAPVPRADGQAGRRLDRGPVAGDLDRPEDDVAQPAVDGRHGHRDLRLPAPAVGADRQAALLQLRPADRRAVGRADHRPGHGARGGHALHGAGADRARAQGRVRQAARGAAQPRASRA